MSHGRLVAHGLALVVFTLCLCGLCLSTVLLLRTPAAMFDRASWQWVALGQSALGFCTWFSFAIVALSDRGMNVVAAEVRTES